MVIIFMNAQYLELPAQDKASQNPSICGADDLYMTPLPGELLVVTVSV